LKLKVDVNCDLGESYGAFKVGNDEKIMPHITSANIACGFHAGDPITMTQTIMLAKRYNVAVGAHPGYPDLLGFGRREMQLTYEEVKTYTLYQIGALLEFAKATKVNLQHVKPHGALYNKAAEDEATAKGIVDATKIIDRNLIVFAPKNSTLAKVAADAGLKVAHEFFADRNYNADGILVSRKHPQAIINDPEKVVERTVKVLKEEIVTAMTKEQVNLGKVHTICVHGDTPKAMELAKAIKKELVRIDVEVKPVGAFL